VNWIPPRPSDRPPAPPHRNGGFTLIEVLVTLVILGIVAAIVVMAVITGPPNTAEAACQTSYKTVETAAEAYEAQTGQYPTQITDLTGQALGLDGKMDGPWLKDLPDTYTVGSPASVTNKAPYGVTIDPATQSIAVGTIKANGALSDTGTPLVDGDANCSQA
jgi:prepilin-type N-terminal cleavage/methylation domain-containing protein